MAPEEADTAVKAAKIGQPHAWEADLDYCAALAPKRRPPAKRGHRWRMRDRTRHLQRRLKRGDL